MIYVCKFVNNFKIYSVILLSTVIQLRLFLACGEKSVPLDLSSLLQVILAPQKCPLRSTVYPEENVLLRDQS